MLCFVVFLSASYQFSLTPLCPMLQLTSHLVKLDSCVMEVSLLSAKKGCFVSALKHAHKTLITESDFISDLHLSAPPCRSLLALNYLLSQFHFSFYLACFLTFSRILSKLSILFKIFKSNYPDTEHWLL